MKYLFIILLIAGCCAPKKVPSIKKDTITGHFEYSHDEEMQWVPNKKHE